jgi:hypothetical protein
MVESYIKTVEEHPITEIGTQYYPSSSRLTWKHGTMGFIPASLLFWRELRLPCYLLFGVPPDNERPTIDHAADYWAIYTTTTIMTDNT